MCHGLLTKYSEHKMLAGSVLVGTWTQTPGSPLGWNSNGRSWHCLLGGVSALATSPRLKQGHPGEEVLECHLAAKIPNDMLS